MGVSKRITSCLFTAVAITCVSQRMHAQDEAQRAALQQKLKSEFTLTTVMADRTDVVTAGSVLVLHKSGLTMASIVSGAPYPNNYKNGTVSTPFSDQMVWTIKGGANGMKPSDIPKRKFVPGETFWVKDFEIQKDGVMLVFYSDPYNDVRYYGQLKIAFPKGMTPPADDVMKSIAEVVTVQPPDSNKTAGDGAAAPQDPVAAIAPIPPMADIPPPPPPTDAPAAAPKTMSLGEEKAQVIADFGQPTHIANAGAKEIDFYPDLKVTYIQGKVTDIQ